MAKEKNTIKDLIFDNKNANKHTQKGLKLLEKSMSKLGAGRSILTDKNNNIIAGNGVVETAGQIGIEDIQFVDSDGTKIIAVRRTDIDLDSKKGRELALADNQTAKVGIDFDFDMIENLNEEYDFDFKEEWDFPDYNIADDELNKFFEADTNQEEKEEKDKIILQYSLAEIETVKKELLKHGKSYEAAVWNLLGL